MGDKLRALLASVVVVVLGLFGVLTPGSPAQANTIHNCNDAWDHIYLQGVVCMFDGTNYGTYQWHVYNIRWLEDYCENLPGNMKNVISSMAINPTTTGTSTLYGYYIRFWPNDNCVGTPSPLYPAWQEYGDPDLRTTDWGNVSNVWNSLMVYR
jgi:hypothetical protein